MISTQLLEPLSHDVLEQNELDFDEIAFEQSDASTMHRILSDETEAYPYVFDSQALLASAVASQSECRKEFTETFAHLVRESEFEFGCSTPADDYLNEALAKYGVFAREWINDLFLRSFSKPYEASGILRVIAHCEYQDIYPQGVTMAIAALRHKDAAVRECGIRCFENWEQPSCLSLLRSLEIEEGWLREYLLDVISDLEGLHGNVAAR